MLTKQAIQQFTRSIPWKDISRLVVPQVLLMFTTLFIGLTDTWVAGRISSAVQASVGVIGQIQAFVMVLAMGLGSGAMAVVSQSLGARRQKRANRYALLVLYIVFTLAASFALLGSSVGNFIMEQLQIPLEVRPISLYFWNVLLVALPFHYLYFVSNILFRASKLVNFPLYIGIAVCAVNTFGDLGFGLGYFGLPNYGVAGVAWTTFASVLAGALLSLTILIRAKIIPTKLILPFRWVRKAAPYLIKVALPALLTQGLWQTGYLVLFGVAASVPESTFVLAGLAAGMRIESILFMPAVAFSATASILVGHSLGAKNVPEAKKLGFTVGIIGATLMSLVGALMFPFMYELAEFFSLDPKVIENIVWYLIFNIISTPFTVGNMVFSGIMTGAGATIYSLIFNTTSVWCVRLPLAYCLAHFAGMGAKGVFLAMFLSTIYQCFSMLYVFLKRPWYKYAMRKV